MSITCKVFTFRYLLRNVAYPSEALKLFLRDIVISFEQSICIGWERGVILTEIATKNLLSDRVTTIQIISSRLSADGFVR